MIGAHAVIDAWLGEVEGESVLSWWRVLVWAPHDTAKRKLYTIKALDDNMAAKQGLRLFEKDFAEAQEGGFWL